MNLQYTNPFPWFGLQPLSTPIKFARLSDRQPPISGMLPVSQYLLLVVGPRSDTLVPPNAPVSEFTTLTPAPQALLSVRLMKEVGDSKPLNGLHPLVQK